MRNSVRSPVHGFSPGSRVRSPTGEFVKTRSKAREEKRSGTGRRDRASDGNLEEKERIPTGDIVSLDRRKMEASRDKNEIIVGMGWGFFCSRDRCLLILRSREIHPRTR